MEMISVTSSNIKAIGWQANMIVMDSATTKDVLRIQYISGLIYDYLNVPKEVFAELLLAESKGSYIHRKIKDKYFCLKINSEF